MATPAAAKQAVTWVRDISDGDRSIRSVSPQGPVCPSQPAPVGLDIDGGDRMAVRVFAGIPVRDYDSALEWYKRLLGAEPAFYPTDIEAVWQLAEDRYVYIIQDPDRAGGAVSMIWVDDPVAEVARISGQGLEPVDVEKHDSVWKYVFHDSDGNETGIGGEVSRTG
jgi:catechol 2,3-dioxygenase-like lactoylglutathione lyase family enzyme